MTGNLQANRNRMTIAAERTIAVRPGIRKAIRASKDGWYIMGQATERKPVEISNSRVR